MSSRRILIIAIAVLVIIVCVGLYFLFFGAKGISTIGTPTQSGQTGSLPTSGTQSNPSSTSTTTSATSPSLATSFGVIASEPVLDYFVASTNIVTAIEPSGAIIQVANGQASTISSTTMQNILSASFSYDGTKILVSLGSPANPQASVFDVVKGTWTALAAGLQSPVWSPSDYRIAYYTAGAQGTEAFATVDASKPTAKPVAIITLHAQDLAIAWPTKNQIVLSTKPSSYVAGSAWAYNLSSGAMTPVAVETPALDMLWSGSSFGNASPTALEFSAGASTLGGELSLVDLSGNVLQRLNLATLPSKCLFASAAAASSTSSTPYLYCGVPRDQNTFSVSRLPDDYNEMALFTSDDIYRINLQSGAVDTIFNDPSQNLDVSDVKFFNNTLFFINRYDQKLYGVQI